ncbi:MAG: hypothetical protein ACRDT8_21405 [Micromonosporaceae bacterium]
MRTALLRGAALLRGRRLRGWIADPVTPALFFALAGLLGAWHDEPLTWAVIGGLAGHTLSGSV